MKIYNLKCFDILKIICALCMGGSYHTIKLEDPLIKLSSGVTTALVQFDLNTNSPFISLNPLSGVLFYFISIFIIILERKKSMANTKWINNQEDVPTWMEGMGSQVCHNAL